MTAAPTPEELLDRIESLLSYTCESSRPCKACATPLYFVRHANGRLTPYTRDGVNHFTNCPQASRFSQRSRPAEQATLYDSEATGYDPA